MDPIFDEKVDYAEMEKIQKKFLKEKEAGVLTPETRFSYAWCLVRCKSNTDVNNGIKLLEQLFKEAIEEDAKRDYLYYVAFGYTRIREYSQALKFTKAILEVQPQNHQVKALQDYIEKRTKKDGLIGLAVVGGAAAVALGGLIGLGVALAKK